MAKWRATNMATWRARFSRAHRRERRAARRARVLTPFERQRHDLWIVAKSLTAIVVVWTTISFVSYVGHDNGDTTSQRMATWGRDHHLGALIDWMETKVYSTPPSKTPAKRLDLVTATGVLVNQKTVTPVVAAGTHANAPGATSTTAAPRIVVSGPAPVAPAKLHHSSPRRWRVKANGRRSPKRLDKTRCGRPVCGQCRRPEALSPPSSRSTKPTSVSASSMVPRNPAVRGRDRIEYLLSCNRRCWRR